MRNPSTIAAATPTKRRCIKCSAGWTPNRAEAQQRMMLCLMTTISQQLNNRKVVEDLCPHGRKLTRILKSGCQIKRG